MSGTARKFAAPRWRLAATWALGVSVGVLVRAAFIGHIAYDFWGVALAFTALFVPAARGLRRLVA